MTTSLILGSVRKERKGILVARYMHALLRERGHKVHFIDPLEFSLPFLDKMYKEYKKGEAPKRMEELADLLTDSDGFVVVTAEYNHSIPPALKNTLDHFQKEYFFKPSGIVSYSSGAFGGVRAAVHLRVILAELGTPSIPSSLPIPNVGESFTEEGILQNEIVRKSTQRFLDEYEWYLNALQHQRKQGLPY